MERSGDYRYPRSCEQQAPLKTSNRRCWPIYKGAIKKNKGRGYLAYTCKGFLEIKVLEMLENQEMLCPPGCLEARGPFQCYQAFKPYMMTTPIAEKLIYTIALVEASNVSAEEKPIFILPEKTQAIDSAGYSFDGCGFLCTTLSQILQAVHDARLSDIEIPRGSKSRFLLVYPEVASGRRIAELRVDIYSFEGWSRCFLERCTLSFEQGKSGEKNTDEKAVETIIPVFNGKSTPKPESTLDTEPLGQDLEGFHSGKCLICGNLLFEPERRFCSTDCLIAYNRRRRRRKPNSTLKPESSPDEEYSRQGLIRFLDEFGNPKWGSVEETAKALLPRLREWTKEKEIEWTDVSAFLNTQEITFHYQQTKIRLINTLFSEISQSPPDSIERLLEASDELAGAPSADGRRCPECGGQRLIRHGVRNELFCMDCCFVLRS